MSQKITTYPEMDLELVKDKKPIQCRRMVKDKKPIQCLKIKKNTDKE